MPVGSPLSFVAAPVVGLAVIGCSSAEQAVRNAERDAEAPGSSDDAAGPTVRGDSAVADAGPSRPRFIPSQLPPGYECEPTLDSLGPAVFATSCTFDTCHGNNDAAVGLRLTGSSADIEAALIGVEAGICDDWVLVAPGAPERSLLLNKLAHREPACGEPMPRGVEPLPADVLECIATWIEKL